MRECGKVVAGLAFIALSLSLAVAAKAQEDGVTAGEGKTISDREKAGLRGPVRSVEEEQLSRAWTNADGKVTPESRWWNKTEYDREGRVTARLGRNAPGENGMGATSWVRRSIYDDAGRLLRLTVESDGKVQSETIYEYDDKGRLKSITNSKEPDNPIAFRYDENGGKTKIAISKPINLPEGTTAVSQSMSNLFDDGSSAVTSDGGTSITIYDEHDRPTEVQMHNLDGARMSRAVRVYDDQGRVIEEKVMMDDPLAMIPATEQRKILDAGATAQQLRDQLAQFLGGSEMWSEKYSYDAQGRKIMAIRNTFNHIKESTSTAYNEHGDIAREITHCSASGTGNPAADVDRDSETVYSYEYDAGGNWTFKKTASRDLPNGVLKDTGGEVRRRIEYY